MPSDTVFVTGYAPSNVSINADMTCSGLVVLSDTYYPGWYAKVDGQPAPIYEVDLALRGVPVPKGAHVVSFHYRPRSVFWGASLTLAGVLGAPGTCILEWKESTPCSEALHH